MKIAFHWEPEATAELKSRHDLSPFSFIRDDSPQKIFFNQNWTLNYKRFGTPNVGCNSFTR